MYKKVRPKTCCECGLEAIDAKRKRMPSTPDKAPCLYCERNPQVREEVFDFYSETWVLEQLTDGSFSPTIEDPDKHEQLLLNVVNHCCKVYGSKT
jgi:hypothetical protein